MTEQATAVPAGGEATADFIHSTAGNGPLSVREAARSLTDARRKANAAPANDSTNLAPAEQPQAPPEQESAIEADPAPPVEANGETAEPDPAPEAPPIDPPKSWSKEKRETWAKLDRDLQEYLAEHDREASATVRRAQNEVSEQRKSLEAESAKVTQARQQYETALPILLQNLQSAMAGEFSDIQTMADVQRRANEDFPRYARWDAQQKQLAAVQQEILSAQQRQAADKVKRLDEFRASESRALLEVLPELAEPEKMNKAQTAAVAVLRDVGFKDEELGKLWSGDGDLSVHDHRFQRILHEAAQFRAAKESRRAVLAAPKPPVQKPGAPRPAGADKAAQIQALEKQLATSTGSQAIRLGAQLMKLRRAG